MTFTVDLKLLFSSWMSWRIERWALHEKLKGESSFCFWGIFGQYSGLYAVVRISFHAGHWQDVDLMWPGLSVLLSWRGTLLSWGWEAQRICWWRRWWFCWTSQTVSSLSLSADTETGFGLGVSDPPARVVESDNADPSSWSRPDSSADKQDKKSVNSR